MNKTATLTDSINQLFKSKFNYWFGYFVNFSLVAWLASRAFEGGKSQLTLGEWFLWGTAGLALWTLIEYVSHRYIYHTIADLGIGHNLHHEETLALVGVPWYLTTIMIVGIYYGVAGVANPAKTGVVMAFIWLGYITYCWVHHCMHHFDFKNSWFRYLRQHHLVHHAHPVANWGLTTTLWDWILRSRYEDVVAMKKQKQSLN